MNTKVLEEFLEFFYEQNYFYPLVIQLYVFSIKLHDFVGVNKHLDIKFFHQLRDERERERALEI